MPEFSDRSRISLESESKCFPSIPAIIRTVRTPAIRTGAAATARPSGTNQTAFILTIGGFEVGNGNWKTRSAMYSAADNLTKVLRTHTLKAGAFYELVRFDQPTSYATNSTLSFSSTLAASSGNAYADTLLGYTTGFSQQNFNVRQRESYPANPLQIRELRRQQPADVLRLADLSSQPELRHRDEQDRPAHPGTRREVFFLTRRTDTMITRRHFLVAKIAEKPGTPTAPGFAPSAC